jgi:hypothetical protein
LEEGSPQFLPPRPAGPEPELGPRPAPPAPPEPEGPVTYAPPANASQGPQAPAQPHEQQTWTPAAPQAAEPDNGPAVAGFVLSLVSVGLLVITFGLSSIVSLGCAIFGMVYANRGKKKVASGETTRNAGIANAGWIISIVSLVLLILATVVYAIIAVLFATNVEFREDFEREFDNSETIRAAVRLAIALVT